MLRVKFFKAEWFPFCGPFIVFMLFVMIENLLDSDKTGPIYGIYPVKTVFVGVLIAAVWSKLPTFRIVSFPGSICVGILVFAIWVLLDPYSPWLDETLNLSWASSDGFREGGFNLRLFIDDVFIWWLVIISRVVGTVLVVPLAEELFWRGWLQRWLVNEKFTSVQIGEYSFSSFSIVTILFASVHSQVFVALVAGVIFGLWVVKTKSLWDVVLSHAVANLLLAVFVLLTGRYYFW